MHKNEKKKQLEELKDKLAKSKGLIVNGFTGMTVAQDYDLRKQVRAAGGKYRVVKNNLAELAAEGTPAEKALKGLAGPTAISFTEGDPVALAKALTTYAKANSATFTFKAGVVEGRVVDISEISQLATLPSKEELIGKLLYLLNAPAQQLVTVVGAVARNLAVVVDQAVKENKFSE
jgi:large subunit ribosomal protein L10